MLQRKNGTSNDVTTNSFYQQNQNATANDWYNEQCYNERMRSEQFFISKINMLQ